MVTWGQVRWVSVTLTRVCCVTKTRFFPVGARASSFHPASRNRSPVPDATPRDVVLGVTRDRETVVCFHQEPDVPYELTKPVPRPECPLEPVESHDVVLKSHLDKDVIKDKKAPSIEKLAKMFYTTKHRWYPVGQYHTRRRNRNPPRDR